MGRPSLAYAGINTEVSLNVTELKYIHYRFWKPTSKMWGLFAQNCSPYSCLYLKVDAVLGGGRDENLMSVAGGQCLVVLIIRGENWAWSRGAAASLQVFQRCLRYPESGAGPKSVLKRSLSLLMIWETISIRHSECLSLISEATTAWQLIWVAKYL